MRRKVLVCLALCFVLLTLGLFVGGCSKKRVAQQPPPPPPAPPAAPTISLRASPTSIERGQSVTLTWDSSNAESVVLEPGIGRVDAAGSRSVSPNASTLYIARAAGPGGTREAEARVTVATPAPPTKTTDTTSGPSLDELLSTMDIFFDFDRYDLRSDARETLKKNSTALRDLFGRNPDLRVVIEGHCDERGTAEYNMALGDRRATATRDFLVSLGVPGDRVATVSYGQEGSPNYRPDSGHNEEAWAKNRRSHFVRK